MNTFSPISMKRPFLGIGGSFFAMAEILLINFGPKEARRLKSELNRHGLNGRSEGLGKSVGIALRKHKPRFVVAMVRPEEHWWEDVHAEILRSADKSVRLLYYLAVPEDGIDAVLESLDIASGLRAVSAFSREQSFGEIADFINGLKQGRRRATARARRSPPTQGRRLPGSKRLKRRQFSFAAAKVAAFGLKHILWRLARTKKTALSAQEEWALRGSEPADYARIEEAARGQFNPRFAWIILAREHIQSLRSLAAISRGETAVKISKMADAFELRLRAMLTSDKPRVVYSAAMGDGTAIRRLASEPKVRKLRSNFVRWMRRHYDQSESLACKTADELLAARLQDSCRMAIDNETSSADLFGIAIGRTIRQVFPLMRKRTSDEGLDAGPLSMATEDDEEMEHYAPEGGPLPFQKKEHRYFFRSRGEHQFSLASAPWEIVNGEPRYSVAQVARIFAVTNQAVYGWIKANRVRPFTLRGRYCFDDESIRRVLELRMSTRAGRGPRSAKLSIGQVISVTRHEDKRLYDARRRRAFRAVRTLGLRLDRDRHGARVFTQEQARQIRKKLSIR